MVMGLKFSVSGVIDKVNGDDGDVDGGDGDLERNNENRTSERHVGMVGAGMLLAKLPKPQNELGTTPKRKTLQNK